MSNVTHVITPLTSTPIDVFFECHAMFCNVILRINESCHPKINTQLVSAPLEEFFKVLFADAANRIDIRGRAVILGVVAP